MNKLHNVRLPNPSKDALGVWCGSLDTGYLHNAGWLEVNNRMHGVALSGRLYAGRNFPDEAGRRKDFIDGMTFGLLALIHSVDVDELDAHLSESAPEGTGATR